MDDLWISILVITVVLIVLFLIFREIVMWYWKINKRLSALYDILDELREIRYALQGRKPADLTSGISDPPNAPVAAPLKAGAEKRESVLRCPQCQRKNDLNSAFCEDCGYKLA